MSHYKQYIQELTNSDIIENEFGFVRFCAIENGTLIEDIYISPEYRLGNEAFNLVDKVVKIALDKGHKTLFGSVHIQAKNCTESMKFQLRYGMQLFGITNNYINLKKEIK